VCVCMFGARVYNPNGSREKASANAQKVRNSETRVKYGPRRIRIKPYKESPHALFSEEFIPGGTVRSYLRTRCAPAERISPKALSSFPLFGVFLRVIETTTAAVKTVLRIRATRSVPVYGDSAKFDRVLFGK